MATSTLRKLCCRDTFIEVLSLHLAGLMLVASITSVLGQHIGMAGAACYEPGIAMIKGKTMVLQ
jgi:hypothetical protein